MFAFDAQSLFGVGAPAIDDGFCHVTRQDLGQGAWIEVAPGWLEGDGTLYDVLADEVDWSQPEVSMYERRFLTPRLVGCPTSSTHPVLAEMVAALSARYGVVMDRISANWYRTGSDSVAWHGDRVARDIERAVVAVVSVRGPREFRFRPAAGGPSRTVSAGFGDLIVMGGTFQRTWRHSVPKVAKAPPRMAVMLRHAYDPGTLARLAAHDRPGSQFGSMGSSAARV